LSASAEERFRRLSERAIQELERTVEALSRTVSNDEEVLSRLQVSLSDASLVDDIRASDEAAAAAYDETRQALALHVSQFTDPEDSGATLPALDIDTAVASLAAKADELRRSAQLLSRVIDLAQAEALRIEVRELRARQWIANNQPTLLSDIERLRVQSAARTALALCDTQPITNMSGRLTRRYVTEGLRAAFARELGYLGTGRIRVRIASRGQYGAVFHHLELDGAAVADASVPEVVSEGEFRAIALSTFLAERHQSASQSGIVVDDPVTSLDHQYRGRVASRLVQEAGARQVIVFTHDLVFLHEITAAAETTGVAVQHWRLQPTATNVAN
jgi:uncharacterized coiled-coil protein SlyX